MVGTIAAKAGVRVEDNGESRGSGEQLSSTRVIWVASCPHALLMAADRHGLEKSQPTERVERLDCRPPCGALLGVRGLFRALVDRPRLSILSQALRFL
jgi:hypothetical protein